MNYTFEGVYLVLLFVDFLFDRIDAGAVVAEDGLFLGKESFVVLG